MTTVRKVTGRAKSMPVGLVLGMLVSLGITLVMAMVGAKLVDMGKLQEGTIGYIALATLLVSAFCGGWTAMKSIKRQKLAVCGLSALIYYGILLSMTALLFGGQYQGMGVTALVVLCGAAVAALIGTRQGRGGPGKRRRRTGNR